MKIQYRHSLLYCTALCCTSKMCFLQIEGKTLHQHNYNSLYCNTHITVVDWNQTHCICEAHLQGKSPVPREVCKLAPTSIHSTLTDHYARTGLGTGQRDWTLDLQKISVEVVKHNVCMKATTHTRTSGLSPE